jgi:hypothetical protein
MRAKARQELIVAAVIYAVIALFFAAGRDLLPDSRKFPNMILLLMAAANTIHMIMAISQDRPRRRTRAEDEKAAHTSAICIFPCLLFSARRRTRRCLP